MAALGIFAHYYLDVSIPKKSLPEKFVEIESIGGLFYKIHFSPFEFPFGIFFVTSISYAELTLQQLQNYVQSIKNIIFRLL